MNGSGIEKIIWDELTHIFSMPESRSRKKRGNPPPKYAKARQLAAKSRIRRRKDKRK